MSRTGLVLSAFVLAVGLLWWVAMSDPHSPTTAQPESPREPEPAAPPMAAAPEVQHPPAPEVPSPTEPTQVKMPAEQPSSEAPTQVPAPKREGPVDELKALFASEPRDSAAPPFESRIEAAFRHEGVPDALFKSVLCRQSVCKIELRWAPERSMGYMIGMTLVSADFDKAPPAIDPVGEPAADGTLIVHVYWPRPAALK